VLVLKISMNTLTDLLLLHHDPVGPKLAFPATGTGMIGCSGAEGHDFRHPGKGILI
jgi:hypothetical protein